MMWYLVTTPPWLRRLYPKALWHLPSNSEKTLYLTFDDGPVPEMTPTILQILKEYHAQATFFCVGDNVRKYPALYRNLQEEGHATGNHTFHHLNGWKTPVDRYVENVEQCAGLVESRLFRPPHGCLTYPQYRKLANQYRIVMWDVLSGDFDPACSPEKCLRNVTLHARPGSIVVLHDNIKAKQRVLYALPRLLDHFSNQGYRFRGISAP